MATQVNHGHLSVMWKTVSEDCNLACDYCYYSRLAGKIPGPIRRIESATLAKFIREYMSMTNGVSSFTWQGGEPMLAGLDFFREVVSLQAQFAPSNTIISNSIQTNATLITEEWAQFFREYNFLVGVSIDGPKELHDARRTSASGHGSFDRVMKGVQWLRRYGVEFNILTVVHEGNVSKVEDIMNFFRREGFRFVQFIPCMDFHAQEPNKPTKYLISAERYGQFLCDVFDVWYNEGHPDMSVRFFDNLLGSYLDLDAELCIHQKLCPTTLVLEQNGDAYPCDFYIGEDYKLGNVKDDCLSDIIGNYVHQRFLEKKPSLPLKCKSCEFLHLCHGGCPRNRTTSGENELNVDYFCESYLQIYRYAHEKMTGLSERIRLIH